MVRRVSLTEAEIRKVAAEAMLDPRTVRRVVVDGEKPRSSVTLRAIATSLRAYGHKAEAEKVEAMG